MTKKQLLNVGGNSKSIPIPSIYQNFEHHLLDIDSTGNPDVLCDARELHVLNESSYDVVYCSHNLEHYYKHDVKKVLSGFNHILKPGGAIHIIVPNMMKVFETMINEEMDIDDILYQSTLGPILISDVIYGYGKQIESSNQDFFAHKTGFTEKSLSKAFTDAQFENIKIGFDGYNLIGLAFKGNSGLDLRMMYGI
jgi:ubiquinone/menaquinone biosynthesis C-methylase UbiE